MKACSAKHTRKDAQNYLKERMFSTVRLLVLSQREDVQNYLKKECSELVLTSSSVCAFSLKASKLSSGRGKNLKSQTCHRSLKQSTSTQAVPFGFRAHTSKQLTCKHLILTYLLVFTQNFVIKFLVHLIFLFPIALQNPHSLDVSW
jgi:hypothetical protein